MTDLNEIRISGTVLRDPILRRTKADHDMCSLQVCVRRPEPSKAHDYLDVVVWEDLAAKVADEFHAGERILITGRLRKNNYTGNDGMKHVTTQIIAEHAGHPEEEDMPFYPEALEASRLETMA